jgi:hypothetical protein
MTLAMAWIRRTTNAEELVFASDSRLRFGCPWDSCQKVFPLPRGDCAITFAGDTHFAYPFIHTAINAVSLHRGSGRRLVDLVDVVPVLLRAINAMLADIGDLASGLDSFEEPELRLVFGGYSWRQKRFRIWKFHFNAGERQFRQVPVRPWHGLGSERLLIVIGNPDASTSAARRAVRRHVSPALEGEDVQRLAKNRLVALLDQRGRREAAGFDMEPLEVLRDFVREGTSAYVGGPPQVVKVYQHLNTQAFGIRWPDEGGRVAVLGRVSPPGEALNVPVLNPETLKVEKSVPHRYKPGT